MQISERAYGDLGTRLKINNRPERVKDRREGGREGVHGGGGGGAGADGTLNFMGVLK